MPVLVLDEEWGRAESLLAIPLRAQNKSLGALVLVGARGSFGAAARRVLESGLNQARRPRSRSSRTGAEAWPSATG